MLKAMKKQRIEQIKAVSKEVYNLVQAEPGWTMPEKAQYRHRIIDATKKQKPEIHLDALGVRGELLQSVLEVIKDSDERIVFGSYLCIDWQGNFTEEYKKVGVIT